MTSLTPNRSTRIAVLSLCATLPFALTAPSATAQAPSTIVIHVDATQPGRTIPTDFLGLSFEANLMHESWIDPDLGNVDTLLENLGAGNIRFSANQVDNTAWMPDPNGQVPDWAKNGQHVTPDDLSRVGALAESTGWSIDLGVNLGHFDPAAAADQVREAKVRIKDSLRSIEIGNEPNFYMLAPITKSGQRSPYIPQTYIRDAQTYREAIHAAVPDIAIEGPNTAGAAVGNQALDPIVSAVVVSPWLDPYISAFGNHSTSLNQHYYPFINTQRLGFTTGSSDFIGGLPSIEKLMSRENADKQTEFIRNFVAKAESAGLKPRLSETNSVAKEGREGVTNSFGAALWTVDYLMTATREGVSSVNLHNQPDDCESYSLICFADDDARLAGNAQVNPNYYSALMVSQLSGGQILPTAVESGPTNITAHAVRMPDGAVKVIVDNFDRTFEGDIDVSIVGDNGTQVSVQRLTADSPESTSGTEYAGTAVGNDGVFTENSSETSPLTGGRYRVRVDEPTAFLLSVN